MSTAALRYASAWFGHWPILTGLLAISAGFIATAGTMEALWPAPAKSVVGSGRSVASTDAPTPPRLVPVPVTYSGPAKNAGLSDGSDYRPPSGPQGMSQAAFNDGIAKQQIVPASLADYQQAINTQFTGTRDQLAAFDQKLRQQYADALAAGGGQLAAGGVRGVIVSQGLASQYGYQAASTQTMQTIDDNRTAQIQQQQLAQQQQREQQAVVLRSYQEEQQRQRQTNLMRALNEERQRLSAEGSNQRPGNGGGGWMGSNRGAGGSWPAGGMNRGAGGWMTGGARMAMNSGWGGMNRTSGGMGGGRGMFGGGGHGGGGRGR